MQENAFAVIIAVMGLFGCLSFGLAGKGMTVLYNESMSMTTSSHPFIKQIKLRRENGMRINSSIHNTYIFVLKNMEKYKYLNLAISEYVKTAWLIQLICVMLGLISGIIKENIWYTAYGCVCAIAVACVGRIEDIERREQQTVVNIVDYFDNVLTNDRVSGEVQRQDTVDAEDETDRKAADRSGNADADNGLIPGDVRLAKQETSVMTGTISDEQRRLIEEVLREYLA